MTKKDLTTYFKYLDDLRASGTTNMFGAAPYLQGEFFLTKSEATNILVKWMKTFEENTPAEVKAQSGPQMNIPNEEVGVHPECCTCGMSCGENATHDGRKLTELQRTIYMYKLGG